MKNKDIVILLAVSDMGLQAVQEGYFTMEEYKNIFKDCDPNKMEEQLNMSNEDYINETKNILKSYAKKIRKEQKIM